MRQTEIDTGKTVLLVIDMQNALIKDKSGPHRDISRRVHKSGVIDNIARVIAAARQAGIRVIFTAHVHKPDSTDRVPTITDVVPPWIKAASRGQHLLEGSHGADFVDELKPAPGDHTIHKYRGNAFHGTNLELILRSWGIDTIIVTGVTTTGCVAQTIQGARSRDFHVIVLSDCCQALDAEEGEVYLSKSFPIVGRVRTSGEIIATITG
ncbi:MAG: isochorismatase family cysteine hydrolase [Chloroflexota bacterium]